jgi:hypothetical protein
VLPAGVRQLKPDAKAKLTENIKRLPFFLEMEGTLCAEGRDLSEAKALLTSLVTLTVPCASTPHRVLST